MRDKIRDVVDDPDVAELLSPDTVIGCKRLCVDTGYYATFNRPNVHLVDIRERRDRADHPDRATRRRTSTTSSTRSCSPPDSTP